MEGNIYYAYVYVDPRNNSPFYVGKGHNSRTNYHLWEAKSTNINNPRLAKIRKIIRETGQDPEIILFKTGLSEDEAFSIEKELIARWGRKDNGTGCLLNLTNGGDGNSGLLHSEETKQKLASYMIDKPAWNKGKKLSETHCKHLSESHKGHTPWNKGLTKETDERVAQYGKTNRERKASC